MPDCPALNREIHFATPVADRIITNRHYIKGYSYYFRQAKWTLELNGTIWLSFVNRPPPFSFHQPMPINI
ncbi:MAG: hypothetical protein OXU66_10250 [Gammaproteobacteria bacterium]|nr:hypothetical protein [Gammaproteobacteria bacterium]MDD9959311.1 hypothetical protein [Gammaproteobacteria bacterium]